MHQTCCGNTELMLLPCVNAEALAKEFLDSGRLNVAFAGCFAAPFTTMGNKTANRIESAQKRRARIVDGAKTANLAKKMRQEASGQK